jgi:cytochrome c
MKRMIVLTGIIILAACSQSEQPSAVTSEQETQPAQTSPIGKQDETGKTAKAEPHSGSGTMDAGSTSEPVLNPPKTATREQTAPASGNKRAHPPATRPTETARNEKTEPHKPAPSPVQTPRRPKKQTEKVVPNDTPSPAPTSTGALPQAPEASPVSSKPSPAAKPTGDIQRGALLARKKCKMCHYLTSAKKKVGPSLKGIYNRAPGISGVPFAVWDDKALDEWLTKPRAVKPKTKMSFPGLKKEKDRQDIIAYLKTL